MNYPDYDPQSPNTPLSDAELAALDALLQKLPSDSAMNIEALDGYLSALVAGPPLLQRLPTADWLPVVWGGDGAAAPAPFASNRQRKDTTVLVLRHLQSIACQLRDDPDAWEPVISVAEAGAQELADAEDWCVGFLYAVDLDPDAWAPLFDDAELGAALAPIALLGGDESELAPDDLQRLQDPAWRDALSRAAVDAVHLLYERKRRSPIPG